MKKIYLVMCNFGTWDISGSIPMTTYSSQEAANKYADECNAELKDRFLHRETGANRYVGPHAFRGIDIYECADVKVVELDFHE
mgnify:CR=1 FL=1